MTLIPILLTNLVMYDIDFIYTGRTIKGFNVIMYLLCRPGSQLAFIVLHTVTQSYKVLRKSKL